MWHNPMFDLTHINIARYLVEVVYNISLDVNRKIFHAINGSKMVHIVCYTVERIEAMMYIYQKDKHCVLTATSQENVVLFIATNVTHVF